MTEFEQLMEEAADMGPFSGIPFNNDLMAVFESTTTAAVVEVAADTSATVRGDKVVTWLIRPANFYDLATMVDSARGMGPEFAYARASGQVMGKLANGAMTVLTPDDVRDLSPRAGMSLKAALKQHGDIQGDTPELIASGDGINATCTVKVSGTLVRFRAKYGYQVEALAAGGSMIDQINALLECSDAIDLEEELTPAEGWWLLSHVFPALHKAATPVAKAKHQMEYYAGINLSAETVRVMLSRINDFAKERKAEIDFQAALAGAKLKGN